MAPPEVPQDSALGDPEPDQLSAQQALQSYYMPVLGGMRELFKTDPEHRTPLSFDLGAVRPSGPVAGRGQDADDGSDADYVDHIQQPGNTKKRKVPANLGAAGPGGEQDGGSEGGEDEAADRAALGGRAEHEFEAAGTVYGHMYVTADQRRVRISRATLAGLSHKEMLKNRKRQLATVVGALTHGDTLALDQALSANYPFASSGIAADLQSRDLVRVRLSRRPVSRLARAFRNWKSSLPKDIPRPTLPECDFSFTVHSASKDAPVFVSYMLTQHFFQRPIAS